jgi:hypothetical protein
MWMMIVGAWLVSLVGVVYFLAGSTRYRDADEADDALLEDALASHLESGRMSGVYYAGEASRAERSPRSDANVA